MRVLSRKINTIPESEAFSQINCKSGFRQPGWLSGLVPPSAQGVTLETWDQVPHQAPCTEPASPSACVSASLSLCVSHE